MKNNNDNTIQSSEKSNQEEKKKTKVKKDNPSIAKLTLEFALEKYTQNPQEILEKSPALFRFFEEKNKRIDKHYFKHYLTEREHADFSSQVISLSNKSEIKEEEAIKIIELVAAMGLKEEHNKSAFLKAVKILNIDINAEKDKIHHIQRGEIAHHKEILRGIKIGLDWSGALIDISLISKDIKIRAAAESMVGYFSLGGKSIGSKDYKKIILDSKTVVIDISALFSIIDKDAPNHKMIASDFLHLINNQVMIVCPNEIRQSLIFQLSAIVGSKANEVDDNIKRCLVVYKGSSSTKVFFKQPLNGENKEFDSSSVHAILLSKEIGTQLFVSDYRVITASENANLEIQKNDVK